MSTRKYKDTVTGCMSVLIRSFMTAWCRIPGHLRTGTASPEVLNRWWCEINERLLQQGETVQHLGICLFNPDFFFSLSFFLSFFFSERVALCQVTPQMLGFAGTLNLRLEKWLQSDSNPPVITPRARRATGAVNHEPSTGALQTATSYR